VGDSRVRLHERDEDRSKFGVRACELNRKSWEDETEVPPVPEVSRTEEGGSKSSICEYPLRDRLRDRGLPSPGQPVQPVDGRLVEIPCPQVDPVQDNSTGSLQATITVTMSVFGRLRTTETVEDDRFSCKRLVSGASRVKRNTS